jgi:hypothetical protein
MSLNMQSAWRQNWSSDLGIRGLLSVAMVWRVKPDIRSLATKIFSSSALKRSISSSKASLSGMVKAYATFFACKTA